jgi:hypothetical protein
MENENTLAIIDRDDTWLKGVRQFMNICCNMLNL